MIKGLFGGVIPLIERSLDMRFLRNKVISSNIANEETPGYKARDVTFQGELNRIISPPVVQLVGTNKRHFSMGSTFDPGVRVVVRGDDVPGIDGNSVSLEKEMVKLAENTIMYDATVTMLTKKLRALREAIKEGR